MFQRYQNEQIKYEKVLKVCVPSIILVNPHNGKNEHQNIPDFFSNKYSQLGQNSMEQLVRISILDLCNCAQ